MLKSIRAKSYILPLRLCHYHSLGVVFQRYLPASPAQYVVVFIHGWI